MWNTYLRSVLSCRQRIIIKRAYMRKINLMALYYFVIRFTRETTLSWMNSFHLAILRMKSPRLSFIPRYYYRNEGRYFKSCEVINTMNSSTKKMPSHHIYKTISQVSSSQILFLCTTHKREREQVESYPNSFYWLIKPEIKQ